MEKWRDSIDPSTIPADVLWAKVARQRSAIGKTYGAGTGRPPIMRRCPDCKAELRRNHKCPAKEGK